MKKNSTSLGGIANSGIFGFFGTAIHCRSDDDTIYCNIMKFFNLFLVFLLFIYFLHIIYKAIIVPTLFNKNLK